MSIATVELTATHHRQNPLEITNYNFSQQGTDGVHRVAKNTNMCTPNCGTPFYSFSNLLQLALSLPGWEGDKESAPRSAATCCNHRHTAQHRELKSSGHVTKCVRYELRVNIVGRNPGAVLKINMGWTTITRSFHALQT
jgi:hypothetical protein